ncbi:hypothetical protein F9802_02465 [Bacillus aerolatus]|uniref:Lipoprotein n=1 Tax=Bacillus aerolatus TaxID=2653354 RepID=A0A6I1FNX7_9BACI|nr:hypothetical protein [Bacillus aerolatus]KAB7709017.1 hypothetical protein F9802_02465 [Bacillus aerolatus]
MVFKQIWKILVLVFALMLVTACSNDQDMNPQEAPANSDINTEEPSSGEINTEEPSSGDTDMEEPSSGDMNTEEPAEK